VNQVRTGTPREALFRARVRGVRGERDLELWRAAAGVGDLECLNLVRIMEGLERVEREAPKDSPWALVAASRWQIVSAVKMVQRRRGGSLDDLVQEGILGAMRAAESFVAGGGSFAAYAWQAMAGEAELSALRLAGALKAPLALTKESLEVLGTAVGLEEAAEVADVLPVGPVPLEEDLERARRLLPTTWGVFQGVDVVSAYFGLNGQEPRTMAEVGASLPNPVSQQSVLQILHKTYAKVRCHPQAGAAFAGLCPDTCGAVAYLSRQGEEPFSYLSEASLQPSKRPVYLPLQPSKLERKTLLVASAVQWLRYWHGDETGARILRVRHEVMVRWGRGQGPLPSEIAFTVIIRAYRQEWGRHFRVQVKEPAPPTPEEMASGRVPQNLLFSGFGPGEKPPSPGELWRYLTPFVIMTRWLCHWCGGPAAVAEALGVTEATLMEWVRWHAHPGQEKFRRIYEWYCAEIGRHFQIEFEDPNIGPTVGERIPGDVVVSPEPELEIVPVVWKPKSAKLLGDAKICVLCGSKLRDDLPCATCRRRARRKISGDACDPRKRGTLALEPEKGPSFAAVMSRVCSICYRRTRSRTSLLAPDGKVFCPACMKKAGKSLPADLPQGAPEA